MKRPTVQVLFLAAALLLAAPAEALAGWTTVIIRRAPRPPSARELAARAHRATLDASRARFMAAHLLVTRDHPITVDIEFARQTLVKAQQAIDLEIADARAELRQDVEYRKLTGVDRTLADKVIFEKDAKRRTELATERLALRAKISSIETAAVYSSPRVRSARTAATEARSKLAQFELDRRLLLLQVPELAAAKSKLVTARASLVPTR